MTGLEAILLVLAAIGAGGLNAVVGAGTLITFPTLLAIGLPPVLANVSNTVGLVPGSLAGAWGYRHTLSGQRRLIVKLSSFSTIGAVIGGVLLLVLPSEAFEVVVPVLLLMAAVLAAAQPRIAAAVARRQRSTGNTGGGPVEDPKLAVHGGPVLLTCIAATGVYGGYFGAAQGVLLLAILGIFVSGDLNGVNGLKNILAATANAVSAVLFIAISDVDWVAAALVAIGATIGGWLGGKFGRRLPSKALRSTVVVVALGAAAWQGLR